MTDFSQKLDKKTINKYIDILADDMIAKSHKDAYYKSHVYASAGNIIFALDVAQTIDRVLAFDVIKNIRLDFENEYNDEGGTYLSVNSEITYQDGDEETTETVYEEIEFIDHIELDDGVKKKLERALSVFLDKMGNIDEDEFNGASSFYESTFTQANSAMGVFREKFPEQMALIEQTVLNENVNGGAQPSKMKSKI